MNSQNEFQHVINANVVPEGGGGLRRQPQDAALGWANEALFGEPWSMVVRRWSSLGARGIALPLRYLQQQYSIQWNTISITVRAVGSDSVDP